MSPAVISLTMKALLRFFLTGSAVFIPIVCAAQYSFTTSIHGTGSSACREAAEIANRQLNSFQVNGIPTKRECEMVRRQILNIKVSSYGCNIYYTCSPCVGTDISSGNYTNPTSSNLPVQNRGVEVKNQVSDYDYQRDVLLLKNSVDLITTHNADYSQTLNNKLRQEMDRANMSGLSMQLKIYTKCRKSHTIYGTRHAETA